MIAAHTVSYRTGPRFIIRDVSLRLHTGEITAVVGPNGAGKSTLLKLLSGSLAPSAGYIRCDGKDLRTYSSAELAQRRAVLSQHVSLGFPFTVSEVVELPLQGIGNTRRQRIRDHVLDELELSAFAARAVQQLSGGEQQRVHLARVLAQLEAAPARGPQFVFLDEPVSSLDIRHQASVLKAVRRRLSAQLGAFVILHDLNLATAFADRIVVLSEGKLARQGPASLLSDLCLLSEVFGVALRHVSTPDGSVLYPVWPAHPS